MYWSRELANFTIPIFFNWLLKFIWEYYATRWFFTFTLLFSHLADAFIQSDLQIRKSNYNCKLKLYKYYIYTFKKNEEIK